MRTLALCLVVVLAAGAAHAQGTGDSTAEREEARRLYEEGNRLGEQGRWEDAVERFRSAAQHADRPSIAYNLARALFELRRYEETQRALDHLAEIASPTEDADLLEGAAQLRNETEARLAELRRATPSAARRPIASAAPAPATRGPSPSGFVIGGVGLAMLIAGFSVGGAALAADGSLASQCTDGVCPTSALPQAQELERLTIATDILLATGAAITVLGIVLIFALEGG